MAKLHMRALAIFLLFVRAWTPAEATTLQRLSLKEMAEKSTSIVRVRITGFNHDTSGAQDVYTVYWQLGDTGGP